MPTPEPRGPPSACHDRGSGPPLVLVHGGASLLGWSLGAQVALAALPRIRRRVSRLALVSATPCFTLRDDWPHGVPARALESLALRVRRDPPSAVARFFDGMFAGGELDRSEERR